MAALAHANDPANGIAGMGVAGHSLGGSALAIFAAVDGHRLRDAADLTVVALAYAGIGQDVCINDDAPLAYGFDGQSDPAQLDAGGMLVDRHLRLIAGDSHIGLSHPRKSVTFPERADWPDT
ncbi:alpha/beta hydrolase family protein [Mangrovicoccus ximenensis]|uniref:hypothetical protein n=1 Tax=Mangrovicoccus ximenensis TaxID=1911570 RepID=UPI000D3A20B7|nr:hypothetical protein [Mangrovicoccus ximenensis]